MALLLGSPALSPAAEVRPNILFIFSDDHAAQSISCYGSRINQTPHIDRLAAEGMRFTHCFAVNSICSPSRAAILTGKYHHLNGVPVFNRFDGSQSHVAKLLQSAGYQTALIGKWHLFSDPTGFDYWNILPGQGEYHNPVMIENGHTNRLTGYVTDLITDQSIDFLKGRDVSKPFLLFTHHKAVHRPWQPDAAHASMYEADLIPEPATFLDNYVGRTAAATQATLRIGQDLTSNDLKEEPPDGLSGLGRQRWNYQRYIKDYLRCVASMDDNIGRLLNYLDASGLATNTVVIYASDQGFFLGEHGWFDKRFMYEESIRMPLLIRYPGRVAAGGVSTNMLLNIDLAPTFLDLAGVKTPSDMQGRSILPILKGSAPSDWRESMYYRYYHYPGDHNVQPHFGVRTHRFKLIYFENLEAWELYDLERDPLEMDNRASDPQFAGVKRTLQHELARLRREFRDEVVRSPRLEMFVSGGVLSTGTHEPSLRLSAPFGAIVDRAKNVFVVDMLGNRVLKRDFAGGFTVLAGDGTQGDAGDGGPAQEARLNGPHSIALAPNGDLYIADSWNHRVRRIEARTSTIRTVAGTGVAGFSGDGGPATHAQFNGVYGISLDASAHQLYVTDLENRRIRKVDLTTGIVQTVAGNGGRGVPKDGALASHSPLVDPRSVTVDRQGNVYILERSGNALRVVERTGTIRTVAGTGEEGASGDGGDGRAARLRGPKDVCVDLDDSVLIADTENHVIRRYDPRTRKITRVAGTGVRGADGTDGPPQFTDLNQPHGVSVGAEGELYVSDSSNRRVLRLVRDISSLRVAREPVASEPPPRLPPKIGL